MSKKTEEAVVEKTTSPEQEFVIRKLKAINEMTNKAVARRAAERVARTMRRK